VLVVVVGCAEPELIDVRAMTWNVYSCRMGGLDDIGAVIADQDPDVVGLQEVQRWSWESQYRDQAAELAGRTGLYGAFFPVWDLPPWGGIPGGGQYGFALLSRWPVERWSWDWLYAGGEREPRKVVRVELSNGLRVAVAHLTPTDAITPWQAADMARGARGAHILLTDLNAEPDSLEAYVVEAAGWSSTWAPEQPTWPARAPRSCIDYVFISEDVDIMVPASVIESQASDHLPVVTDVKVTL
jgi:endonuclease/exonuclease/phosphatase family metal-dependent hydrolase